nr:hypothetical protein [Tanacetum cinerariifolium]
MATFLALLLEHQDCDRYSWGYSFACIQQGRMSTPETVVANNELNQFMNQVHVTGTLKKEHFVSQRSNQQLHSTFQEFYKMIELPTGRQLSMPIASNNMQDNSLRGLERQKVLATFGIQKQRTAASEAVSNNNRPNDFMNQGVNRYPQKSGSSSYKNSERACSVGQEMDLLSFIQTADPTKVRIGERQRDKDEPKIFETTIGRVVPLLPVALAHSSSELEASVDKLFDERGSGEQAKRGDSASGGHGVGIQLVDVVAETVVEDVAPAQPKRQKKQKTKVVDTGEPSHPAKKLRDDHGASNGPTVGGKSQSSIQRLFTEAVQNAEVRGRVIPTFPFVTSSVSTTSKHEGETELLAGANLRTIGAPTSVPIITSATTTTPTPTVDPAAIAKEKLVGSSVCGADSPSAGGSHPIPGGFSDCTGSDFLISGIRTVIDPDSNLQKVYVPHWNVTNGSCLDDGGVCREMMSLSAEVRMRAEYNIRERRRLNSVVEEKDALLKAKDEEIGSLKAQLSEVAALKERNNLLDIKKSGLDVKVTDLAASVKVREQEVADLDVVEKVTSYENYLSQLEKFQDDRMREMNDKFDKLDTDLVKMALHLEERFYPHLLTTISERRWLLTRGLELAIAKCLNSTEYLSTLGAAIGKAVEKGMQDELSAGITHGAKGMILTDVAAYNPSAEVDYLSALQRLQSVNFSLITELKSNKDASIDTTMNLLRLEDSLAEKLGLTKSQPHVDQLMVPIHHSLDQRVISASALSLSLDVSSSTVRRIKENIAKHRSALRDVFVPLSEPLSITALTGTESTLNVIPVIVDTTMAMSVTSVLASLIPPISTDDYEITHAEGEKSVGADANPFPDVCGSCFPSQSLSLYAPFSSASVTSYGPSHLGPSFPVSFARLASLLRSTFVVLSVGMPISAGMTAFVPYVNENGVSSLLDFIIVR